MAGDHQETPVRMTEVCATWQGGDEHEQNLACQRRGAGGVAGGSALWRRDRHGWTTPVKQNNVGFKGHRGLRGDLPHDTEMTEETARVGTFEQEGDRAASRESAFQETEARENSMQQFRGVTTPCCVGWNCFVGLFVSCVAFTFFCSLVCFLQTRCRASLAQRTCGFDWRCVALPIGAGVLRADEPGCSSASARCVTGVTREALATVPRRSRDMLTGELSAWCPRDGALMAESLFAGHWLEKPIETEEHIVM